MIKQNVESQKSKKLSVLVTGASGGMGRSVSLALRDMGFVVFALDKASFATNEKDGIISFETDITNPSSLNATFQKIKNLTDNIFAIIHFAGIYTMNSLVEISKEEFEKSFRVNLFGAFLVNKTFLPLLKSNSRIIMTTSELAPLDPLPFTGLYAITKSALDKYAYSLAMELQLLDIHVSVLRAGAVDTNMIGASTTALEKFCANTQLYECNAKRFKSIVDSVESKKIKSEQIARKVIRILRKKNPAFAYNINRNRLLILFNLLPKRIQMWLIKKILSTT